MSSQTTILVSRVNLSGKIQWLIDNAGHESTDTWIWYLHSSTKIAVKFFNDSPVMTLFILKWANQ